MTREQLSFSGLPAFFCELRKFDRDTVAHHFAGTSAFFVLNWAVCLKL
jgi:hypothetical protein